MVHFEYYARKSMFFARVGLFVSWFVCLSVCLYVCLPVRPSDYLNSNERICMTLLPEVCLGPRTNTLNSGDDPAYDH